MILTVISFDYYHSPSAAAAPPSKFFLNLLIINLVSFKFFSYLYLTVLISVHRKFTVKILNIYKHTNKSFIDGVISAFL